MFSWVIGGLGLVLHEPVNLLGLLGQILLGGGVARVLGIWHRPVLAFYPPWATEGVLYSTLY